MKNLSLKSLVLGTMTLAASFSVNAGNGTQASPYTVCATSGFKLTTPAIAGGTYQWFDANDAPISGATNNVYQLTASGATAVSTTSYKVQVTNNDGCASEKSTFYVTSIPAPTVTAEASDYSICGNASETLNLTATATMGNLPSGVTYSYAWTGSTGTGAINNASAATATTTSPSTVGAYTYLATVTYAGIDVAGNGCTATGTTPAVTINAAPSAPAATISGI